MTRTLTLIASVAAASGSSCINTIPADLPPIRMSDGTSVLYIGVLSQMFKTARNNYAYSMKGANRFAAVYMAIKEINDKTDGIADDLLPNTQIKFAYHDTHADSYFGFFDAANLVSNAFGGKPISAVIGPAFSGVSAEVATVLERAEIPQISFSATSPALSNSTLYPYFMRTPPSDAFQGAAMADVVKNLMGYTAVATVNTATMYGSTGMGAFLNTATAIGLNVLTSVEFNPAQTDFSTQIATLRASGANVVVIFCHAGDAATRALS